VRCALALVLALGLSATALAAGELHEEQTVTAVEPQGEQRVEPIAQPDEQRVQLVDAQGEQDVSAGHKGPMRRGVETAGKVVLGVLAAGVSVGVMLAEVLLL
jgi:hypothetical protein